MRLLLLTSLFLLLLHLLLLHLLLLHLLVLIFITLLYDFFKLNGQFFVCSMAGGVGFFSC